MHQNINIHKMTLNLKIYFLVRQKKKKKFKTKQKLHINLKSPFLNNSKNNSLACFRMLTRIYKATVTLTLKKR